MAWRVGSPPLRRARSDTQAAGGRGRDSQRPALRLGSRSFLIWSSRSSVLQTDRSTKSTNVEDQPPADGTPHSGTNAATPPVGCILLLGGDVQGAYTDRPTQ